MHSTAQHCCRVTDFSPSNGKKWIDFALDLERCEDCSLRSGEADILQLTAGICLLDAQTIS